MDGDMFRVFRFHLLKYILFGAGACLAASQANADPFTITLENPGAQQSSLFLDPSKFGVTDVYQENFDSYNAKVYNHLNFDGSSKYGSYDTSLIRNVDVYGGAGGTGSYFDVNTNLGGPAFTTLTLKQPERYFGLWWSAGDPNNVLQFYSGNTLVVTFHSSDVINFINSESSTLQHQYLGNPNNGGDPGEYFAYLNFFADPKDQSVTFDRIVFSNSGNSGFESDNHTIAASYTTISGTPVPEPSTFAMMGIGGVALIGMIAIRSRRRAVV
jgi:PEP-CTERM motif